MICRQIRWAPSTIGLIYAHIFPVRSHDRRGNAYFSVVSRIWWGLVGCVRQVLGLTQFFRDVCIDEPYGRGSPPSLRTDDRSKHECDSCFNDSGTSRAGNAVSESGNIVADTAARIFADLADPQAINSAGDGGWKAPLWQALAEAGLTLAWVPEAQGGAGAGLADGFEILSVAGRFAAPV